MALVSYSDSEDDPEADSKLPALPEGGEKDSKKRKRGGRPQSGRSSLPPLPPTFHSLYTTSARAHTSDDPDLHGGRVRQIPHIEGNWPTHVYLEWYPSRVELRSLQRVIEDLNSNSEPREGKVHSLLQSDLGAQLPLHVSLSTPLVLRAEQKGEYEDSLAKALRAARFRAFRVNFTGISWEPNFDRTRFFLVLKLGTPVHDELNRLLDVCNGRANEFDLPLLYEEGGGDQEYVQYGTGRKAMVKAGVDKSHAFHISIAWQLDAPSTEEIEKVRTMRLEDMNGRSLRFGGVKLKMGNIVRDMVFTGDSRRSSLEED